MLHGTAPNLQELSLAANLLATWEEVSRLAEELPLLHSLDLSWNRMAFPAEPSDSPQITFAALRRLILNHCCIGWEQVNPLLTACLPTPVAVCFAMSEGTAL